MKPLALPKLSLPPCELFIESRQGGPHVWDPLRRLWVPLTPEEWVRQHFAHFLIEHLGYPPELLNHEVGIRLGARHKRLDGILYDSSLRARMLLEYKAPSIALSDRVLQQALRYNYALRASYLVLSNGLQHIAYQIDYDAHSYSILTQIPHYQHL